MSITEDFSDSTPLNRVPADGSPREEMYLPLILVNQKEGFDFLLELLNPPIWK